MIYETERIKGGEGEKSRVMSKEFNQKIPSLNSTTFFCCVKTSWITFDDDIGWGLNTFCFVNFWNAWGGETKEFEEDKTPPPNLLTPWRIRGSPRVGHSEPQDIKILWFRSNSERTEKIHKFKGVRVWSE